MLGNVERKTTVKIAMMCSDVIQWDFLMQVNDDRNSNGFELISIHGTLFFTLQLDGTF